MKHAQDGDGVAANAVGHQVTCFQHDQFAGVGHSTWSPETRLLSELSNRSKNTLHCGLRIWIAVKGDIGGFVFEVLQRDP